MNIILVHTLYRNIYGKIKGIRYLDPPLGLAYVASSLLLKGHQVSLIDAEAEGIETYEELAGEVARRRPDVVGFGFTTPMVGSVRQSVKKLREILPDIPLVVGGPHATAEPEEMIRQGIADYCVIGEGEETMVDLVGRLSSGEGIEDCRGLCFAKAGRPVITAPRPPIADLDALPFPARNLFKVASYKHFSSLSRWHNPNYSNIITSRGCPYKCIFCGSVAVFGKRVRFRSPEAVVDEIEECCRRYRIGILDFVDDTLTLKKSHVIGICDEISSRKLDIRWKANCRVDTMDEEILRAMKRSGCKAIYYGYESGNQEVLDRIKKGITLQQSVRTTELTRKVGLEIHGFFMIGNPGENPRTIRDTINLAKRLNPDTAQFTLAQPFPGTEFYRIARKDARFKETFENFKWYDTVNYVPEGMNRDEIRRLHRRAYREYYFRPAYMLKVVRMMCSPSKWGWLLRGIRTFLKMRAG